MSVKISYGPYEAHGVIRHRTQRLMALIGELEMMGYSVELVPTRCLEVVTIEMRGKQIYRFNIKNLMFNAEYEDDVTAQKIVKIVEEHKARFYSEYNVPCGSYGLLPRLDSIQSIDSEPKISLNEILKMASFDSEAELNKMGYEVELKPSRFLNFLQVDLHNKKIFRGDMRNLLFNVDCEDDPVATRIINCVEEARHRFESEDNIPSFQMAGALSTTNTRDLISSSIDLLYEIPKSWDDVTKEKEKIRRHSEEMEENIEEMEENIDETDKNTTES